VGEELGAGEVLLGRLSAGEVTRRIPLDLPMLPAVPRWQLFVDTRPVATCLFSAVTSTGRRNTLPLVMEVECHATVTEATIFHGGGECRDLGSMAAR
jgi:hypothetical protein